MTRTTIEAERILPYAPADLCRLVGDVRAYPEFVPWLQSLRVVKEEPRDEGGWEGVATAIVGWKAITERFSTTVRCEPAKGEVDVALVSGPFHALDNRWRFEPHEKGAKVRFWISYQFKNPLLNAVVSANKDKVAARVMGAFEREAKKRLGR
ncbi:type II toxin-antitoxin system RatA family toxin [Vitreimonas flagellata]|uniref:type II toxin-antitoxin system RatA family toxin n=1 Tax=Vitreimonas flagellata TaxID=2560861 RepID=UPI001EF96BE2|nr:type II toxin-antitoxin system RatA family toxin [Vitreimonas flagellata]